jgi:hypothetical protein
MTTVTIIGLIFAILAIAAVSVRIWLRSHPGSITAQYRLCGIVMWLGVFVSVAGAVLSFVSSHPTMCLLQVVTGLLITTSMLLQRKSLARKIG